MASGTSAGRAQGRANAASFGSGLTFVMDHAAVQRLLTSTEGPVGKDITRRTLKVHRAAVRLCAVDTGRLRASITWRLGRDARGLLGIVGTNVEYGPYLEFGTRYMAAQPFLRPALASA